MRIWASKPRDMPPSRVGDYARRVEALGMAGQDGVGIGQQFRQLGTGIEPVVRVELGPVVARQPRLHRRRQPAPDDHDRLCVHDVFLSLALPGAGRGPARRRF